MMPAVAAPVATGDDECTWLYFLPRCGRSIKAYSAHAAGGERALCWWHFSLRVATTRPC